MCRVPLYQKSVKHKIKRFFYLRPKCFEKFFSKAMISRRFVIRHTMLCCKYHFRRFCQTPPSPFLNMSYFTYENEIPARRKLERKRYDIWFREKMIYIDIGYMSAHQYTDM